MRVRWLRVPLANLEADYIAEDNPAAADRLVQRIMRAINALSKNPAMGRPGRVSGTRELVVGDTPTSFPIESAKTPLKSFASFTPPTSGPLAPEWTSAVIQLSSFPS